VTRNAAEVISIISSPEQPDRASERAGEPTSGRQTLSRSAAFFGPARTRDHYFCFSANIAYFSSNGVQTDNLALAVNNYTARSREPKNSLSKHRASGEIEFSDTGAREKMRI
jgi:hypothetical protein